MTMVNSALILIIIQFDQCHCWQFPVTIFLHFTFKKNKTMENNIKQNNHTSEREWDGTSRMGNEGTRNHTDSFEEEMYGNMAGSRQRHTRPQSFHFDNFGIPYPEA